jgi:hypothetical protein
LKVNSRFGLSMDYTALYPRRQYSSQPQVWEPQILRTERNLDLNSLMCRITGVRTIPVLANRTIHLNNTGCKLQCRPRPSIHPWHYSPFVGPWPLFSFLILYTVGSTPWTGDQPVARPASTHRTTETQNKRTQTSMPWVGFEPTIPVLERAKTVHALDRAATVTGCSPSNILDST